MAPALHLAESLATELRLYRQRLLGDHRVRTGGPGVDLVVHQVVQLHDVHVANGHRVRERLATAAVEQLRLSVSVHHHIAVTVGQRAGQQALQLLLLGAIEYRRRHDLVRLRVQQVLGQVDRPLRNPAAGIDFPAGLGDPTEVSLQDLADVHPSRHTVGVQDDVHRRAVRHERMSSTARILPMTPLLPCRPASLSPSEILRFWAT